MLAGIVAVLVTAFDIVTPLGYGEWALYALPILILSAPGRQTQLLWSAGLVAPLMVTGLVLSPAGIPLYIAILNRIGAYIVFWIIALLFAGRNRALMRQREASSERDDLATENRVQREFYQLVLASTPVGIAVVRGPEYRYEYANPFYGQIPGKSAEFVQDRTVPEVFPDYAAQGGLEVIDRVMRTGEQVDIPELETVVGFGSERRKAFFSVSFVPLAGVGEKENGVLIVAKDITELARNRKRFEQTAARDEAILASVNDGLVLLSPGGEIDYMNGAGLTIDGYSALDEMPRALPKFIETWRVYDENGTELDVDRWPLARAMRESFRNHVYRVVRLDMPLDKYCSYSGRPVYDLRGNLLGAVATFQDISELKKTELLLRQREQEYKTLAENIPEVIARFDRQLRHTYVNSYGENVYGVPRQQVLGKTNTELAMPEDKVALWKAHFDKVLETGIQQRVDFDFLSPTYGRQYFSSLFVAERDGNGEVTSILAITRDITDLKEAENRIRASEARFRQLADSMPQLVWTANPDGTIDYYNEKFRDFGGITSGEDGLWQWRPVVHEEELQLTIDAWQHSVSTGEIYQIEHRIRHADGSFHWYLSRGIPVRNENGDVIKWYGTATNIDISKQAQRAIEESENRLKLLNQNLEDMVVRRTEQVRTLSKALSVAEQRERKRFSYILHEKLQQLLLGAKMLLGQHMRDHKCATGAVEEYDDVADGLAIIEKALQTTRSMSIELNPPILRSQGLDSALEWLTSHVRKNYGLRIELDLQGEVGSIRDEWQLMLTQMVRELLNNVIEHAGVQEARVTASRVQGGIRITVSDEGQGFDAQAVFAREGDERRLGLFSIRERLRLFGGTLTIDSAPGKGTRCDITLPAEIR
jgi:PAS domain S-box-containing protein